MKPIFWGHNARNHNSASSNNGFKLGDWIFDESCPTPEGVKIFRHTHPAVWTGELAEDIKAELRRRSESVRGSASPDHTHRFSGLAVCGECGYFMATFVNKGYRGLICPKSKSNSHKFNGEKCRNTKIINEKKIAARLDDYITRMLTTSTPNLFEMEGDAFEPLSNRAIQIDNEISDLEAQARNYIRQQARASDEIRAIYDEELTQVGERLRILKRLRVETQSNIVEHEAQQRTQNFTLAELSAMTMQSFWQQQHRYINQVLHRLMGRKRFVIINGEIAGIATVHRRQRKHS